MLRNRAVVAYQAHNLKVSGANPLSATILFTGVGTARCGRLSVTQENQTGSIPVAPANFYGIIVEWYRRLTVYEETRVQFPLIPPYIFKLGSRSVVDQESHTLRAVSSNLTFPTIYTGV